MMPKFQRRSMTPEGNTNKLLFLFSNETLFSFSSKAGRNGHQEIIKLKGGKKAVAHRRYAVSTASPSCSSSSCSSCSSPKKNLSILLPLFFFLSLLLLPRLKVAPLCASPAPSSADQDVCSSWFGKRRGSSSTAPNIRPIRSQHATGTFQF